MDAKVVDRTGIVISDEAITIKGFITRNLEASDTILLEINFPLDFRYLIVSNDYEEYFDFSNGLFGSYYICKVVAYDRVENAAAFIRFALDVESECALFILPDDPEQYLVCSTVADVNVEEVMAHFQKFLDAHS